MSYFSPRSEVCPETCSCRTSYGSCPLSWLVGPCGRSWRCPSCEKPGTAPDLLSGPICHIVGILHSSLAASDGGQPRQTEPQQTETSGPEDHWNLKPRTDHPPAVCS